MLNTFSIIIAVQIHRLKLKAGIVLYVLQFPRSCLTDLTEQRSFYIRFQNIRYIRSLTGSVPKWADPANTGVEVPPQANCHWTFATGICFKMH